MRLQLLFRLLVAFCIVSFSLKAQNPVRDTTLFDATNAIRDIVKIDNKLYLSGSFSYIGNQNNYAAFINPQTFRAEPKQLSFDDYVTATTSDDSGGWYLAGQFTTVSGTISGIIHLNPDLSIDTSFKVVINNNRGLFSLTKIGNTLYFGGLFDQINGVARNNAAAVNSKTGALLSWNPNANNSIRGITKVGSNLLILGDFSSVGGQFISAACLVDSISGQVQIFNLNLQGSIYCSARQGNTLYLGGNFSTTGANIRSDIVALNLNTLTLSNVDFKFTQSSFVLSLASHNGRVFVGGVFTSINNQPIANLVVLDSATGNLISWFPSPNQSVNSISVIDSSLYVFGNFSTIAGESRRIAIFDLNTLNLRSQTISIDIGDPYYLTKINGSIFVSGSFLRAGGRQIVGVAEYDLKTKKLGDFSLDFRSTNVTVVRSVVHNDYLYILGSFTQVGDSLRNGFAQIDLRTGLATGLKVNFPANPNLRDIVIYDSIVFIGGQFSTVNGTPINNLVAFSMNTGNILSFPGTGGQVNDLLVVDTLLYVAGTFNTVNNVSRNRLAAINLNDKSLTSFNLGVVGVGVNCLVVVNDVMYMGGTFTNIANTARRGGAAYNLKTKQLLPWNPQINTNLNTIAVHENAVYLGGSFSQVSGVNQSFFAVVTKDSGKRYASNVSFSSLINKLLVDNNTLYAGGFFTTINGKKVGYFAGFDITPCIPTPTVSPSGPTSICVGNSVSLSAPSGFKYLWSNGDTTQAISVNSPGSYTVRTILGTCTSFVSVPVIVNIKDTSSTNLTESICKGQSFSFGTQTLTTAGTYRRVLQNALGCDSAINLTLNVKDTSSTNLNESICKGQSFSFGTQTLTTAGTYRRVLQNALGCDSAINLTLNVIDTSSTNLNESICKGQSFSFGTQTLTTAGTYRRVLQNALGCDSAINLTLNVKDTSSTNLNESICKGQSFSFGTQTLTTAGTYRRVLQNTLGCDSAINLTLTVRDTGYSESAILSCQGVVIPFGNQNITTSGSYLRRVPNANGCDSTIRLIALFKPFPLTTTTLGQNGARAVARGTNLSYSWQTLTGTVISTTDSMTAINGGTFRLVIADTAFGVSCADTSDPIIILNVGQNIQTSQLIAYPNPASDFVTISGLPQNATIRFINSLGSVITINRDTEGRISLADIASGIYLLEINSEGISQRIRLTVNK